MTSNEDDIDAQLAAAKLRLEAFQDAATGDRLLSRLEREAPVHPLLVGYKFFIGLMAVDVALALTVLAVPLVSMDWTRRIVGLEMRTGMPLPILLLILAFCAAAIGLSLRYGAILRGQRSPLLVDEMKDHQAIASELARLSSKKRLQERGIGA